MWKLSSLSYRWERDIYQLDCINCDFFFHRKRSQLRRKSDNKRFKEPEGELSNRFGSGPITRQKHSVIARDKNKKKRKPEIDNYDFSFLSVLLLRSPNLRSNHFNSTTFCRFLFVFGDRPENKQPTSEVENQMVKYLSELDILYYLIIGRRGFDGSGHDQTDLCARLAQNGRHLLRAHAAQADFANLKDMISTL